MLDSGVDVLVDAGRDLLSHLSEASSVDAKRLVTKWLGSGSVLLRRLAVWGVANAPWLSADEKLQWVLENDLLFELPLKTEVFEVLAVALSSSSSRPRLAVLARAEQGPGRKEQEARSSAYETYNLLVWLGQYAPSDRRIDLALKAAEERNPDFIPRPHPDLHMWSTSEWSSGSRPESADQLLEMDPAHGSTAEWIATLQEAADIFEPDQWRLHERFAGAATQDPHWAVRLLLNLADQEVWRPDIWRAIVYGLTDVDFSASDRMAALEVLRRTPEKSGLAEAISRFLLNIAERNPSARSLSVADKLSDETWKSIESLHPSEGLQGPDWLTDAINQAGGQLAQYWLRSLSTRLRGANRRWLPRPWIRRLDWLIHGQGADAEAGRVVLASQAHFLLAVDGKWWKLKLNPLFTWDDARRAEQVWDGYLMWARLDEGLIEAMLPAYVGAFAVVGEMHDRWRERFTEHLAWIGAFSARDPMEDGWLSEFVAATSTETRASWAAHLGGLLRNDRVDVVRVWERWLRRYWTDRISGLPRTLEPDEQREMAGWVVALPEVLAEAVQLYVAGPRAAPRGFVWSTIGDISDGDNAQATAEFLLALLEGQEEPFYSCRDAIDALQRLEATQVFGPLLDRIRDRLLGLGCL